MMDDDFEPDTGSIEFTQAINVDCLQHAICHCPCHHNEKMQHITACCYECPYCNQNVIFTGKQGV